MPTSQKNRTPEENWDLIKKDFRGTFIASVEAGKRLDKSTLAFAIGHVLPMDVHAISYDLFTRPEMVEYFNKIFNKNIK